MKLELTIPATPGFLHMLPGLDIIALILVYPLMGASLVQETGVTVKLHESPWRYEQTDKPVVITLGAGEDRMIWLNKKLVAIDDLEQELAKLRDEEGGAAITTAVLRADVTVPSGVEKDVMNRILKLGLDCKLLGRSEGKR